jgi:hypothetical protein
MRLGIRTKQGAGVTAVGALAEAVLFAWYFATLTQILLDASRSRADFMLKAVYQQAFAAVARGGDPAAALRTDEGVRGVLSSAAYMEGVDYARIVDREPRHRRPGRHACRHDGGAENNLDDLIEHGGPIEQLRALYTFGVASTRCADR